MYLIMLSYFLPLAFTKMQQGLELNDSACLKMCSFRDSCVKCLSSGFCLYFIFSVSKLFFLMSSTWRRAFVWLKSDVNPTCLGQLHPHAQILNPCSYRCGVWTVHFRKNLPLSWDWVGICNSSLPHSTGCPWKPEQCAAPNKHPENHENLHTITNYV